MIVVTFFFSTQSFSSLFLLTLSFSLGFLFTSSWALLLLFTVSFSLSFLLTGSFSRLPLHSHYPFLWVSPSLFPGQTCILWVTSICCSKPLFKVTWFNMFLWIWLMSHVPHGEVHPGEPAMVAREQVCGSCGSQRCDAQFSRSQAGINVLRNHWV